MFLKYKIVKEIGKGGFGRALLVKSMDTQELKVAKEIDFTGKPREWRKSALHEAEILQTLKHTNIIKYRNCTKNGNKIFILMDYADGGDLDQFIRAQEKKKKRLPEDKILDIFVQICLGLKYLHDRKILHRDLKPQNVFLTKENIVKLGDFGISKTLENTNDVAKTSVGTPLFSSPEICMGKSYNSKSDIWSLGCILYEMMTFRHAFSGSSLGDLAVKILTRSPAPMPLQYSVELRQLVIRLLDKNPAKRPTINEIFKDTLIRNKAIALLGKTLARSELNHDIFHGVKPGETPSDQIDDIRLSIEEQLNESSNDGKPTDNIKQQIIEKAKIFNDMKEMSENLQSVLKNENLVDVPDDIEDLKMGEFYFMGRKLVIKRVSPNDPLSFKIEALRQFLEEMLGTENFRDLYFKTLSIAQDECQSGISTNTMISDVVHADIYTFQLIMQLIAYENKLQ
ncbi:AGC family protein kinase [Tritrichomonas foetus]|uniref:non-specific serine/threonine protein kinase n=1 Tax=Tritrichomonas foetus TaxID=1144522 RepID=A0A1J4K532_9EUKA|nr:AGC family protein kinase [Tritrichomonas foetus]|eukprot:OHT06090.1 AGC family protein kinase [Tritrichomonas foetus]